MTIMDETDWAEPEIIEPEPPMDDATVDAPYGVNPTTGRPYRMSPEQRHAVGERLAQARAEKAANDGRPMGSRSRRPGSKGTPPKRTARAKTTPPDYTMAAAGLLQIPAFVLGILGRVSDVFLYDSAAFTYHTPAIAQAANAIAQDNPSMAQLLDRATQVGPWGLFLTAVVPLALQIGVNHKAVKPNPALGVMEPVDLMQRVTGSGATNGATT